MEVCAAHGKKREYAEAIVSSLDLEDPGGTGCSWLYLSPVHHWTVYHAGEEHSLSPARAPERAQLIRNEGVRAQSIALPHVHRNLVRAEGREINKEGLKP